MCCLLFMVAPSFAATLAVVYPKVPAPHDELYKQIIGGIERQFEGTIDLIEVPHRLKKTEASKLAQQLDEQNPTMVITLGRSGRMVGRLLKSGVPWVSGAYLIRPNGSAGITPIADPNVMFENLKELAPEVKRIYVVYSSSNQWLIELSSEAAQRAGYEFFSFKVKNITETLAKYDDLIKNTVTPNDAIWLPIDRYSAETDSVVPMIIEQAWEKRFVVFSSRPELVRRGVLFSFMPDNEVTGIELVKMVESLRSKTMLPMVKTTSVVSLAVNLRTASHLGLEYTQKQKGRFLVTFPTQ